MEQKIKLVIIDNDGTERTSLQNDLGKRENCGEIAVAQNGVEGMELIEKFRPDVVILDIIMPEADGFEVLSAFAEKETKPKFLVYTSLMHENFITKAFMCGADYYMLKPTDSALIWERVEELYRLGQRTKRPLRMRQAEFNRQGYMKKKTIDEQLSNVFVTVGIPANLKGYQFLREGVKLTVDNPSIINNITKQLYPAIANKFETSASKVERAIRHAIEVAWNRGRIENINSWYGVKVYTQYEKPTNGEFIALIADKMLLETM